MLYRINYLFRFHFSDSSRDQDLVVAMSSINLNDMACETSPQSEAAAECNAVADSSPGGALAAVANYCTAETVTGEETGNVCIFFPSLLIFLLGIFTFFCVKLFCFLVVCMRIFTLLFTVDAAGAGTSLHAETSSRACASAGPSSGTSCGAFASPGPSSGSYASAGPKATVVVTEEQLLAALGGSDDGDSLTIGELLQQQVCCS